MVSMVTVVTAYAPDGSIDTAWGDAGSIELPEIAYQLRSAGRDPGTNDFVRYLSTPFFTPGPTRVGRIDRTDGTVVEGDPLDGVQESLGLLPNSRWVLGMAHHPSGASSTLMIAEDDQGIMIDREPNPRQRMVVVRRDAQGDLDTSFGTEGALVVDDLGPGQQLLFGPTRLVADGEELLVLMIDSAYEGPEYSQHHLARVSATGQQVSLGPNRWTAPELTSTVPGAMSLHLMRPDTPSGDPFVLRIMKETGSARIEGNTRAGGQVSFARGILGFDLDDHGLVTPGVPEVSVAFGMNTLLGGAGEVVDTVGSEVVITSVWHQPGGRAVGWSMRYQARESGGTPGLKLVPQTLGGPNKPYVWRGDGSSFTLAEAWLGDDNSLEILTLEDDAQRTPRWTTYGPLYLLVGTPVDLVAPPPPTNSYLFNHTTNCCFAGPDRALVARAYYGP